MWNDKCYVLVALINILYPMYSYQFNLIDWYHDGYVWAVLHT